MFAADFAACMAGLPSGEAVDLSVPAARYAYGMLMQSLGLEYADEAERDRLMDWFHCIEISFAHVGTGRQMRAAALKLQDFYDWLDALIDRRRADPRADIISRLISEPWELAGESAPVLLSNWQVVGLIRQLMLAGANSVRSQLLNCVLELTRDLDLQARLRTQPDLIPAFVEECLRLRSSVPGMWRSAACETTFHGVPVAEGQLMQLRYKAAGLDPRRFPDPQQIKLDRPDLPRHLAFGYGIHNCLGKTFARGELDVGLRYLLAKYSRITLACAEDALDWLPNLAIHGVRHLPVMLEDAP